MLAPAPACYWVTEASLQHRVRVRVRVLCDLFISQGWNRGSSYQLEEHGMQIMSRISRWENSLERVDWLHVCVCVCWGVSVNKPLSHSVISRNPEHRQAVTSRPLNLAVAAGSRAASTDMMNMPLASPDVHTINNTLYFEDMGECVCVGGGRVITLLWPNILIMALTSLFPPLNDPEPHSLFSFGHRYGWDHNYVWTHGVGPYSAWILTQSGSCQCDSPYCS